MAPFGVEVVSAGDLGLPEPDETGDTFIANALLKAHAAAGAANLPALADDSGLAVDALDGAPGIYSARWAGPDKDFTAAMSKVEELLRGAEDRGRPVSSVPWRWHGRTAHAEVFEGTVGGEITWPPAGDRGFGYDPIFYGRRRGHDVRGDGPGAETRVVASRRCVRQTGIGVL